MFMILDGHGNHIYQGSCVKRLIPCGHIDLLLDVIGNSSAEASCQNNFLPLSILHTLKQFLFLPNEIYSDWLRCIC